MFTNAFKELAFLIAASLLASSASAQNGVLPPGSLLVYPLLDNSGSSVTWATLTNTNLATSSGSVRVELIYIRSSNCLETNRLRTLTPGDTLTVNTKLDSSGLSTGYLYAFARSTSTGAPISFNHLIGTARVINTATAGDYEGSSTDLDGDGRRDLNNLEYQSAPDMLFFPRFTGHVDSPSVRASHLVLVSLAGSVFNTSTNFIVLNDNEEQFSSQASFTCWTRKRLKDISGVFTNEFLLSTLHTGSENFQSRETGAFRIAGGSASSTHGTISDAPILGLLVEEVSTTGGSAVLPFAIGLQNNGDLLNQSTIPDTN
jgi:hypothetical protein